MTVVSHMKAYRRTFWGEWKKNAKNRLIALCIAVPIVAALIALDAPNYVFNWIIGLVVGAAFVYALCLPWLVGPSRRERDESAAQFAKWKRRIQDVADNVDMSGCDLTFEELWEYLDEEELTQIDRELDKMPPGSRILRHAYRAITQRRKH